MEIFRVLARWSGFPGAPGYSSFHFAGGGGLISDAQQVAERVGAAVQNLGPVLPSGVSIVVQNEVERLDSDSGELLGYHDVEPDLYADGSGSGGYSGPSGAVVNWRTNDLRGGRRIRGRTFLVPLAGSAYEADGTLTNAARIAATNFGDTLVGGDFDSEFGVWARPIGGSGGVFATATGFNVPDMAAVLRSRRD